MKCLLHIGTEKTGTTLLQHWLAENRAALGAQRVYLPTSLGKWDHRRFTAFFQTKPDDWTRRKGFKTPADKARFFDGFPERFAAEVKEAATAHDLCIITSEHLHSRLESIEEISNVKTYLDTIFDDITVLCYVRDQADMAVSLYSTALKTGHSAPLDQFLTRTVKPDAPYYDLRSFADRWTSVFGRDRCRFRLYDRARFPGGDLRRDVLQALPVAVQESALSFATESRNESLPPLVAAAYRAVNTHLPYWTEAGVSDLNVAVKVRLADLPVLQGGKIDSPLKPALRAMFAAGNAAFLAQHIPGAGDTIPAAAPVPDTRTFTLPEVEAIVESTLAAVLPDVRPEPRGTLQDADADTLRDLAIRLEQGQPTTLEDAALLMRLALRARPGGPFIRKKLDAYTARLAKDKPAP